MMIYCSLFPSSKDNWKNQHLNNFHPFSFCSSDQYNQLFKKHLKQCDTNLETKALIKLYNLVFKEKKSSILFRLKGPCFGITMALIDCHLKNPSYAIENISYPSDIVKTAIFYSLIDIIRARIEIQGKQNLALTCSVYQEQLSFFATFERKTFKISKFPNHFVENIQQFFKELNGSVVLLRVWHTLTFMQTLCHRNLKWVSPHSIFICLNEKIHSFYFYDIELKAFIQASSLEEFINLFIDYIHHFRSAYLTPQIIWRFESKKIEC